MTDVETKAQSAMTVEVPKDTVDPRSIGELLEAIVVRLREFDRVIESVGEQAGRMTEAVTAAKTSSAAAAGEFASASVSEGEKGSLREVREAIELLREAAEKMPTEASRGVVSNLDPVVQGLANRIDVKLHSLGSAVQMADEAAAAIARDILEARAIHEAHLEVRERWALIVMVISLWFSVVMFLSFGYLWFRL
ncbi:MAG: hypothetical protein H9533_14965 [Rhodobacteraceae bacterium]|nr:hypothetical protein [Paracoccaceae bacterium]